MVRQIWQWLLGNRRKLIPITVVVTLTVIAALTDLFGRGVRDTVNQAIGEYASHVMPLVVNFLIAALLLNVAWLLYSPLCSGLESFLRRSHASQRGKDLAVKLLKIAYWGGAIFFVLSFTASELLGKVVIGFSVFGAALTLALKDVMNDFICGVFTQGSGKVADGDKVELEGLKIEGTIIKVGYLSTAIDSAEVTIRVPNREIWARAVKIKKPAKSPIIVISDN
ncbi:MAG: mechanosensitive ion channel [Candidatus Obscuribacterales bacterium]|nr:mechanosensitive ion channel [Candidatus Obscuribacterales bacterium]